MKKFDMLTEEERRVIVGKGTEAPFSGEYNDHYEKGVYQCRACSTDLYTSGAKFNSGCGWPSFDDEIPGAVVRHTDTSRGMTRTEICCAKCDGHLGHVFEGEALTEKSVRHCVNSVSLKFTAS